MRILSSCSFVVAIASVAGGAAYPPEEVARVAEIAARRNPDVASARADAEAMHALARHHRGWEAPEIAVDFFKSPVSAFPDPLKDQDEIDYSVSQRIPFPGKLRGMAEPEHRRGRAADMRAEAAALDLRRMSLGAYADLYAAEWGLRLARGNRADVEALLGESRRGYASGGGGTSTVLRLEAELARIDMVVAEREGMRREAAAMLAALLANPVDSGGGLTARGLMSLRLDRLPLPGAVSTWDGSLDDRPDLASARLELSASRAEAAAARRELYPDFMLRGMYKDMRGGMPDDWSLMVGMSVPFAPWAKRGADEGVRRARALEAKAGRDLEAARLRAGAEAAVAAAALKTATERATLARERLIPVSVSLLEAAREDYVGGSVPSAEVVEALREVRMAREEYHRAAASALKAWAGLERARGGKIRLAAGEMEP
jgi:outer membrane protein TolC